MNRTEWIKQADRLHQAGQPFALVTVLRAFAPTSSKAGDKAVVTAEGLIHGCGAHFGEKYKVEQLSNENDGQTVKFRIERI